MKSLKDITPEYIEQLVKNKTPENDSLDYKKNLSVNKDREKREFLKDICAMANTNGGIILIGIEEGKKGNQGEIVGVDLNEFDQDHIDRINQIVRDGLEPRYNGFSYKIVNIDDKTVKSKSCCKFLSLQSIERLIYLSPYLWLRHLNFQCFYPLSNR